jgi:hypothetical protein
MKKQYAALFITIALLSPFCSSKPEKPADVIKVMQKLHKSGKFNEIKAYYTKGTLAAMDELGKLAPQHPQSEFGTNRIFADGAKWDIVSEKIEGDTAELKIMYTSHPVENMRGYEMPFRMKKEDGTWKWDMEKDLRESIPLMKEMKKKMGGKK